MGEIWHIHNSTDITHPVYYNVCRENPPIRFIRTKEEEFYVNQHRVCPIHRSPGANSHRLLPCLRRRNLCGRRSMSALRKEKVMTLLEMSEDYEASAKLLRIRLKQLRNELSHARDAEEIWHLKRRIAELTPMLTQMNELADLTKHYYERGYYRSAKYTL